MKISTAAAAAACNAVVDLLDGGSGAGYAEIRTGSQPASVATAASGTLLGTVTLSDPAFGNATTASPAVATANAVTSDTTADATGTAGWFRAFDSAGTAVEDGTCGLSGSGAEMILDSTSIVAGGTIAISSWTISMPTA